MIALMLLVGCVVYILICYAVVRFVLTVAKTKRSKRFAAVLSLVTLLYFPAIEPITMRVVYTYYKTLYTYSNVQKIAHGVDRIYIEDHWLMNQIMMKDRGDGGSSRKFAGYTFFENSIDANGKCYEYDLKNNGTRRIIEKATANYIIEKSIVPLPPFCKKRTVIIRDNTGFVYGEYAGVDLFGRRLNIFESLSHNEGLITSSFPKQNFREFVQSVLIPSEQSE